MVLSYAVSLGFVTDVVVENMDDMSIPDMPAGYDPVPPRFAGGARPSRPPVDLVDSPAASLDGPGIVAVVPGSGLSAGFQEPGRAGHRRRAVKP